MATIQKRSDLKLRIRVRDLSGVYIDMSSIDFVVELYTNAVDKIEFVHRATEQLPPGCVFDNGDLILSLDRPYFENGKLFATIKARIPDASFPDGYFDISTGKRMTGIKIIDDDNNILMCEGRYNVELMLDYSGKWNSIGGGAVDSVNKQTGDVVLDAKDVKMEKVVSSSLTVFAFATNLHNIVGDTADYDSLVAKLTSEGYYV